MKLPTKLILVTSAAIVLCLSSVTRTGIANLQAPLALKIIGLNGPDQPVPASKLGVTSIFRRAGLKMISSQAPISPTGVEIHSRIEGDAIKAQVKVLFNDLDDKDSSKNREETFIGSFILREGESARLSDLKRHSIEPFELKAIKAESIDVPIAQAPIRNQTKSLQATGLTLNKEFNQAHIRLKNVSGKNIFGYMVCVFETSSGSSACQGGGFGPVLKPGEENTIFFPNFPFRVFRSEPGGLIGFPTDKQELVIRTAVFEDGSFEGDAKAAAGIMREQAEWKTNRGK